MMKRILTFLLAVVMVFSLAACGSKADDSRKKSWVTVLDATSLKPKIT